MRESRSRTGFAAVLGVVSFASLGALVFAQKGRSQGDSTPPRESASASAVEPAATVAVQPVALQQPHAAVAACPREPAIDTGERITQTASALLFGHETPWGSASVGTPTRGSLIGGVELGVSDGIELAGDYHWGTASVIRSLERAVREVRRCHPGSPDIYVGDISRERGGWLRPHRSHQAGLDADVGYYYRGPASWYERATSKNLDVVRTWALFRALVDGGNVDTIFVDRSVQDLIKAHLATLPASEQPPDGFFEKSRMSAALVRHAWGHATHFHVRFRDPEAVALGKLLVEPLDRNKNRAVQAQPKQWRGGRHPGVPKRKSPR